MKTTKRAKCPKCSKIWLWDWELDTLRDITGVSFVRTVDMTTTNDFPDHQVTVLVCDCGNVLGALATNSEGSQVYAPEFWKGIDWEQPGCSWSPGCKDCKLDPCEHD